VLNAEDDDPDLRILGRRRRPLDRDVGVDRVLEELGRRLHRKTLTDRRGHHRDGVGQAGDPQALRAERAVEVPALVAVAVGLIRRQLLAPDDLGDLAHVGRQSLADQPDEARPDLDDVDPVVHDGQAHGRVQVSAGPDPADLLVVDHHDAVPDAQEPEQLTLVVFLEKEPFHDVLHVYVLIIDCSIPSSSITFLVLVLLRGEKRRLFICFLPNTIGHI